MSIFSVEAQKELGNISIESGQNPIFNLLAAYSEVDPEVGYTQGMNFLAGALYLAVEDEVIAFTIMVKVMYDLGWRQVY